VKRVLLGKFTPLVRTLIIDALSARRDVALIDQAVEADSDVDVVLMPAPDGEGDAEIAALLWRRPHSRVVVIAASGRVATVYELYPHVAVLGDVSPMTLVEAVCR
jgi:hypothetical protein